MRYGPLIGAVIVFLSCVASAQEQTVIRGTIRVPKDRFWLMREFSFIGIPRVARWVLADNLGIKTDVVVSTDSEGRYSAAIPPGFYDVFLSATVFTPTAAKVRVKAALPATYDSKLRVDPLVSRELAH
jgi:hypothetical protein